MSPLPRALRPKGATCLSLTRLALKPLAIGSGQLPTGELQHMLRPQEAATVGNERDQVPKNRTVVSVE